eukprot:TRINITY_DN65763_c0_g1_i1.p1 TRINITY_DN65763_c0_g1~~TRINITY_DN65763_c0_g1_i1.p1  ORF type:complete len:488 (+),score=80.24 TRINITY_DN65763_c0_g1_i1:158-1621(+)
MISSEDTKSSAKVSRMDTLSWYLLCATCLIEGMDIQLLPASFRAMEVDLQMTPVTLASLAMVQGVATAISGPIWANIVDAGYSRKGLLTTGVLGWSIATMSLATTSVYSSIIILRIVNGISFGMLSPVLQKTVAEITPEAKVGFAFGTLDMVIWVGCLISLISATTLSQEIIFGVPGWRAAFIGVGLLSLILAGMIGRFYEDPPRCGPVRHVDLGLELRKFRRYLSIPTFCIILVQGMVGTIPRAAMTFMTLFFQYCGMTNFTASLLAAMSLAGALFGSLLGGFIGDTLNAVSERHGRPATAQLSVLCAIPFVSTLFILIPQRPDMAGHYALVSFLLGLLSSWCSAGCNKPLFVKLVPPSSRASVMAWETCFEYASGQLIGPAAVGFLAEHFFGWNMQAEDMSLMSQEARAANATALGKSLFASTVFPWTLCFLLYSMLHFRDTTPITETDELLHNSEKGAAMTFNEQARHENPLVQDHSQTAVARV